jgi:AcrR family transcriptional regulator
MDVPDDVALLWGLREAPRRGPRPTLGVDEILRAAVAVADADGLGAVSMARVAAELGHATMALYRHVRSKDELLALMADAALEVPPELPAGDWRAGLETWARAIVAVSRRHPWMARLPVDGPPSGPGSLAWLDRALGALEDTPLHDGEKMGVVMGLLTYAQGQIRLGAELATSLAERPEVFARYGAVLAQLVDPARFPSLGAMIAGGTFAGGADGGDDDFDLGLTLYLDGVAGLVGRAALR